MGIWGTLASKSGLKRIIKLQKKAIRIISHAQYNAHTDPIFKKLNILKLENLIDLEMMKLSYRYVHKTLPMPVSNLFKANSYNHGYQTRARNNPRIEKHTSTIFNNFKLLMQITITVGYVSPQRTTEEKHKNICKSC